MFSQKSARKLLESAKVLEERTERAECVPESEKDDVKLARRVNMSKTGRLRENSKKRLLLGNNTFVQPSTQDFQQPQTQVK